MVLLGAEVVTVCQRLLCLVIALHAAGAIAACGDDSTPTSPTTTTPTVTAAAATISEAFVSAVPVNGSRFYAFEVGTYGTVNVTLDRVGGGGVPTTVWVGISLGVPDGTDCSTTTSLSTQAGAGPHISTTLAAGTYCARIYDIGNLAAAPCALTIAHP